MNVASLVAVVTGWVRRGVKADILTLEKHRTFVLWIDTTSPSASRNHLPIVNIALGSVAPEPAILAILGLVPLAMLRRRW